MWIMTPMGFYSAVANDPQQPDKLAIRGRSRQDIAALADWIQLEHGLKFNAFHIERRDYPWRIEIPREIWGSFLVYAAETLDYSNFKDEVKRTNPRRAGIYGSLWVALLDIEDEAGSGVAPGPKYASRSSFAPGFTGTRGITDHFDMIAHLEDPDLPELDSDAIDIYSMTDEEWRAWINDAEPVIDVARKGKRGGKRNKRGSRR